MVRIWVSQIIHAPYPRNSLCENIYRSPFHAAVGVATCRMLMHLRKFATHELVNQAHTTHATDVENADSGSMVFLGSQRQAI